MPDLDNAPEEVESPDASSTPEYDEELSIESSPAEKVVEQTVGERRMKPRQRPRKKFPSKRPKHWYIIHTYSGFERKVAESLRTRADAFGFSEQIGQILIPEEEVVELRNGKKVTSKRLLYPGYVVVQMDMNDELWHRVKDTPRVTGFVGGGQTPVPLSADEINKMLYRQTTAAERPRPKMTFEKNETVRIIDGPFNNFQGKVDEINPERNTLRVLVTIFGRATPVELDFLQVEEDRVAGFTGSPSATIFRERFIWWRIESYWSVKLQIPAGRRHEPRPSARRSVRRASTLWNSARHSIAEDFGRRIRKACHSGGHHDLLRSLVSVVSETPPVPVLIKRAVAIAEGSAEPHRASRKNHRRAGVEEIAKVDLGTPNLTAGDMEAAMRSVKGTARSMGVLTPAPSILRNRSTPPP